MANITKNTAYIDYQAVRAVFEQSEFVKTKTKMMKFCRVVHSYMYGMCIYSKCIDDIQQLITTQFTASIADVLFSS